MTTCTHPQSAPGASEWEAVCRPLMVELLVELLLLVVELTAWC